MMLFASWTVPGLWRSMDALSKAAALTLTLMALHTCCIVVFTFVRFRSASNGNRRLLKIMQTGANPGDLLRTAQGALHCNVGSLLVAGISAFQLAPVMFSGADAISASVAAIQRQEQMRAALRVLSTIMCVAPFLGLLGTVFGIASSFPATAIDMYDYLGVVSDSIARALVPTAAGLALGVAAVWSHNFLERRRELLAAQASEAALKLTLGIRAPRVATTASIVGHPGIEGLLAGDIRAEVIHERPILFWYVVIFSAYVVYVIASVAYHNATNHL